MPKTHICEICTKEFIKPRINHPSRFCSRDCFYTHQRTDKAREEYSAKTEAARTRYLEKHGRPMGFSSTNNPAKTPEARIRMSQFRKGVPLSPETRRKQSASLKKTLSDPEMRKKWSKAATGRVLDYETKKKISDAHKNKFNSRNGLVNKLDKIYSRYIRYKESIDGAATCITCDKSFNVAQMDCGHYIPRRFMSLRYDERNTHPQCVRCNRFEQGNIDVYTIKIIGLYGSGIIDEFNKIRNSNNKVSTPELESKLEYYSKKLKDLDPKSYPYL